MGLVIAINTHIPERGALCDVEVVGFRHYRRPGDSLFWFARLILTLNQFWKLRDCHRAGDLGIAGLAMHGGTVFGDGLFVHVSPKLPHDAIAISPLPNFLAIIPKWLIRLPSNQVRLNPPELVQYGAYLS